VNAFYVAYLTTRTTQPHRYRFGSRHFTAFGMVPQRHQRISFGVIGGGAAFGNVIGHDFEWPDLTLDLWLDGRGQQHLIADLKTQPNDIVACMKVTLGVPLTPRKRSS
jgi:hypothetical protein